MAVKRVCRRTFKPITVVLKLATPCLPIPLNGSCYEGLRTQITSPRFTAVQIFASWSDVTLAPLYAYCSHP